MEWIINLIKTIFKKNKRKLIEAPKKEIKKEKKKSTLYEYFNYHEPYN